MKRPFTRIDALRHPRSFAGMRDEAKTSALLTILLIEGTHGIMTMTAILVPLG